MLDRYLEFHYYDIFGTVAVQRIQSAARAAALLTEVASSDHGLSASEISSRMGISRPTTYHLINTLVDSGHLFKDGSSQFVLGLAVGVLADGYARQVTPSGLMPRAEALAARTGDSVSVSVRRGAELAISYRARGSSAVTVYDNMLGRMTDPHARASGKLLLARSPQEIQDIYLSGRLRRRTPTTLTSRNDLEREFEEIRAVGYATDTGEYVSEVSCVAAPTDGFGISCLTVAVPTTRFAEQRESLIAAVLEISAG